MELVRDIASGGFPTDYLLARVRGRRAALVRDWRAAPGRIPTPGSTDEAIWEALLREFEWLHLQMNRVLRTRFAPMFALFELKTVVLCLRNKSVQRNDEIDRLLRHSLLAGPVQDALRRDQGTHEAVAAIAGALAPDIGDPRSLEQAYAEGGLRGFENRLTRGYLERVVGAKLHPSIARFFASFIDLRNVMTLYKHLRWEVDDAAAFIPGGAIALSRLREASTRRDSVSLDAMVSELAGRAAPPLAAGEGSLETVLLGSMARELRQAAKDREGTELILDYAWRVYVQARNQAVLLHAGDLDPGTLERELIA